MPMDDSENSEVEQGLLARVERLVTSLRNTEVTLRELLGDEPGAGSGAPLEVPCGKLAKLVDLLDDALDHVHIVNKLVDGLREAF